jgi:hypothetical protein
MSQSYGAQKTPKLMSNGPTIAQICKKSRGYTFLYKKGPHPLHHEMDAIQWMRAAYPEKHVKAPYT